MGQRQVQARAQREKTGLSNRATEGLLIDLK